MGQDLSNAVAFYKSNRHVSAGALSYRVKELAFLHYLGLPLKAIHEYATQRDYYQASYPAFTRWVRRNVNFEALCDQYETEFQALDPRVRLEEKAGKFSREAGGGHLASRHAGPAPQASTEEVAKTFQAVRELPEDTLKRHTPKSFEETLIELGLRKRKL